MSSTLNNSSNGCTINNSVQTRAVTVNAGDDRIMLVGVTIWKSPPTTVVSVTYAGQALSPHPDIALKSEDEVAVQIWYLINPPVGVANLITTIGAVSPSLHTAVQVWNDVDQNDPLGDSATGSVETGLQGRVNLTLTTSIDQTTALFWIGNVGGICHTPTYNGETNTACENCNNGVNYGARQASYLAALSPTTTLSGAGLSTAAYDGAAAATALNPAPPPAGRNIKYRYDFWSPEPKIRDETGREVPANEIRPNNWIEAEGIAIPTMVPADDNIVDPSVSLIVEVDANDRSATIKTDISQFADVLIARAAAGRG